MSMRPAALFLLVLATTVFAIHPCSVDAKVKFCKKQQRFGGNTALVYCCTKGDGVIQMGAKCFASKAECRANCQTNGMGVGGGGMQIGAGGMVGGSNFGSEEQMGGGSGTGEGRFGGGRPFIGGGMGGGNFEGGQHMGGAAGGRPFQGGGMVGGGQYSGGGF